MLSNLSDSRFSLLFVFSALISFIYFFKPPTDYPTTPTPPLIAPLKSPPSSSTTPSTPIPLDIPQSILQVVPFTPQAPLAEWSDPLQQDGCEEASSLMAVMWARNQKLENSEQYKDKIIEISKWEQAEYGSAKDTSAKDTVERIIKGFFKYTKASTKPIHDYQEIINALGAGHLIIAPVNGQEIGNPHYTAPGPERHMLVIKGYDRVTGEFITNDPGTRLGAGFRYGFQKLYGAIRDYPTGNHEPITGKAKVIIIVEKDFDATSF